jgi:hypothetical protein
MPGTLKLKSDAGGSISLAANTTAASDLTVSVPPFAATMATLVANTTGPYFSVPNVVGNGPCVLSYNLTSQVIATNSITKVILNAKIFDTNSCFDSATNYRFTPNVAGYYNISFSSQMDYVGANRGFVFLYRNGSQYAANEQPNNSVASTYPTFSLNNIVVYANGVSDYFEIYVQQNSGGNKQLYGGTGPITTYFAASMVRSA